MRAGKFFIYQDAAGEWRWRLKSANGLILADSGEGYASRANARRALINTHNVAEVSVIIG